MHYVVLANPITTHALLISAILCVEELGSIDEELLAVGMWKKDLEARKAGIEVSIMSPYYRMNHHGLAFGNVAVEDVCNNNLVHEL